MTNEKFKKENLKHIEKVRHYINFFIDKLKERGDLHDLSKNSEEELPLFAANGDALSNIEFGSEEYKQQLNKLAPALNHHYKLNRHHPQHFENGIDEMNLIDLLEMMADWQASSERTKNGDLFNSIEINSERFNISPQLKQILINTAYLMEGRE